MLSKPLPPNFDPIVFNDLLFQTLSKSKQTKHLLSLRAEQIVKEIVKESFQTQLYQKYNESIETLHQRQEKCISLQRQIQKIKQNQDKRKKSILKELKTQNQQILSKANAQLQLKNEQILTLEQELQRISKSYEQLQQQNNKLSQQISQKSSEILRLQQQILQIRTKNKDLQDYCQKSKAQMQKILFTHQQQMQRSFAKVKNLTNTINQMQDKIKEVNSQNEDLKRVMSQKNIQGNEKSFKIGGQLRKSQRQVDKLKKQLTQSQQSYSLLKKQISKFKDKYRSFEQEYNKMKEKQAKQQKDYQSTFQKQLKQIESLDSKVRQLTLKNGKLTKSKANLHKNIQRLQKIISTSIITLRQENLTMKSYIKQNFHLLKQYSETVVTKIVNHISAQMSQYFQECIFQIKKARQEKNFAKQEAKIKSQIIQQLDFMLNNEVKSVYDLRYELKQKIKEQEKLRKRLKHHYQETDKKLQDFQTKYISILKNQL